MAHDRDDRRGKASLERADAFTQRPLASRRKSERVKARVQNKRQRGAAIGQRGKWGRGYLPTEGDIERVRALAIGGKSLRAIEAETGIPRSTVARILKAPATVPNDRPGHRSLPDDAGTA
jgi:DNA invertase Pin-like site-specific DNA recombinase